MSNKRIFLVFYYLIFAISGFAGLLYESIWSHYLKTFLGAAAYAQALVLVVFMGGLFLGAWLVARFIQKLRDPLAFYVIAELFIGLYALIFHWIFVHLINTSYQTVLPAIHQPWLAHAYQWGIASVLILPPSLLLGTTFPLMTSGLIRRYPALPGKSIALLYFSNSLGAAIGVIIAGFILLGAVGLEGSMMLSGMINLLVVAIVFFLNRWTVPIVASVGSLPKVTLPHNEPRDFLPAFLMLCALLTGFASFMYELGWIRMLSMVLGSSMQAFELMLSAFILGLALGSLFINFRIDHLKNTLKILAYVQIAMGLCALFTLPLYNYLFYFMDHLLNVITRTQSAYHFFHLASHSLALMVMLPATIFAGMTLPLLTFILLQHRYGERAIGDIYAWNTLGAILGTVITLAVVMPYLGLKGVIGIGAVLDILTGFFIFGWLRETLRRSRIALFIIVCLLCGGVFYGTTLNRLLMSSDVTRGGLRNVNKDTEVLFHRDGRTATVSVVRYPNGTIAISTNGKVDASMQMKKGLPPAGDESTQVLMGALPLALELASERVAVIGFGSGRSAHELLLTPKVYDLDLIEIEPAMVEGAKYFLPFNSKVYTDPRSHIIYADAKTYFATQNKQYDLIISEPSNPWVAGVASLFTTEFYQRVKQHLTKNGAFAQWLQSYEINDLLVASIFKAMKPAFKHYQIYIVSSGDYLILAYNTDRAPQFSGAIFKNVMLQMDLAHIGIRNVDDLNMLYVGSEITLGPLFEAVTVPKNSDYIPVLALEAPRARFLKHQSQLLTFVNLYDIVNQLEHRQKYSGQTITLPWLGKARLKRSAEKVYYSILQQNFSLHDIAAEYRSMILALNPKNHLCLAPNSAHIWLDYYFQLQNSLWSFLNEQQQRNLAMRLVVSSCQKVLPEYGRQFLNLFQAVDQRNYPLMSDLAKKLLDQAQTVDFTPMQLGYLLRQLLLAEVMQGNFQQSMLYYQKYRSLLKPGLDQRLSIEILLLNAYAKGKIADQS